MWYLEAEYVCNYREVCIQSALAKLFDSLVAYQLSLSYKWSTVLILQESINHRGFRHTLLNAWKKGLQVDAVYTDFAKAFDRVNFQILLAKLTAFAFSKKPVAWLKIFLIGRTQAVKINGSISTQSSYCASLLFILFIDNLLELLKYSTGLLFADD